MRWCRLGLWLVVFLVSPLTLASAQTTGGSFGGSDWGDSDTMAGVGSFGAGGGYDAPERDEPESSDPWDDEDDGGSGSVGWMFLLGLWAVVGVGRILGDLTKHFYGEIRDRYRSFRVGADPRAGRGGRGWRGVDVTALDLVVDWRARRFIQRELERMALSGRSGTKAGRATLLRQTVALLTKVRVAWLYYGIRNHQPMSPAAAQGTFRQLTIDARARFDVDVVREEQGSVTTRHPGALRAKAEEGPGVVVVTLVVAARRELLDVYDRGDPSAVDRLLASIGEVGANELVALEVIWSPVEEDDRLSTAELEALWPEVSRIEGRTIGGRVYCLACGAPYADERARCRHCGAPNPRGGREEPVEELF